ncbi:MAG TPA: hypothetical protein VNU01_11725 [Egibacteraceae bacterium]|nr:hypothetical protein [Egibacteraceae bacterium]
MRRVLSVTALALMAALSLSGCGREASVTLSDGSLPGESSGERSMTGDPDDTLGGLEPEENEPAQDGGTAVEPTGDPDAPMKGAPPPDDPDGCPECTTSTTPAEPVDEPGDRPGDNSGDGGYTTPRPGQEDVRAREWETAEVADDDVTVTLTWWSGVEPCTVLDRVDVVEQADKVVITLYEGNAPGDEGACPAIAVERRTRVTLSAPLAGRAIVDGAKAK